ncbi:hypothetical protein DFS33DRAFT_1307368 [Desarmillaria ectypa]|nr:hypothetical protein DFS33DRAFT_1307368 [Desarmillaria ectypa]
MMKGTSVGLTVFNMSRRAHSTSPLRNAKRAKMGHLISDDFKDGVFLAPMVRSDALPTGLFALKHGATLVWGPETVDKAILHATRNVNRVHYLSMLVRLLNSSHDT